MVMVESDLLLGVARGYREELGGIAKFSRESQVGRSTFRGTIHYESGEIKQGIFKLYSSKDGEGWIHATAKQALILQFLEVRGCSSGRVLDVDWHKESDGSQTVAVIREEVMGKPLKEIEDPMTLTEVRKRAGKLFRQLMAVAADKLLVEAGMGFSGDVSSGNVILAGDGFNLIEWDSQLGQTNMRDVTMGYVAPEVLGEEKTISEVLADTFSLGCVITRALVGRKSFRQIVPVGKRDKFLEFKDIENLVPVETREFLRITLSHNPEDRVVQSNLDDPVKHYRLLGKLLGVDV